MLVMRTTRVPVAAVASAAPNGINDSGIEAKWAVESALPIGCKFGVPANH
jgi:hypothetical protein